MRHYTLKIEKKYVKRSTKSKVTREPIKKDSIFHYHSK